jgi:mannan endo-1,4-beta-mannosidase
MFHLARFKSSVFTMMILVLLMSLLPVQEVQAASVNPNANQKVNDVLNYLETLKNQNKILAGQHLHEGRTDLYAPISEYQHTYDVTGRYPALLGLDMDFGVHGSVFSSMDENRSKKVEQATQHAAHGGLVTFTWHETSPQAIDDSGWSAVNQAMTATNFHDLVTPGTPLYNKWLAHIDLIASYLKELQDNGVVVLWRPYHEMNGGWFWWGNKGTEFKQLWINMYNRFTNHHNLNNLIWVWSPNVGDMNSAYNNYYPGDAYVDLGGVDLYTSNRNDAAWTSNNNTLKTKLGSKNFGLTEVGLLTTPEKLVNDTDYVWYMLWHTGWMDNNFYGAPTGNGPGSNPQILMDFYNSPNTITRDEVPLSMTIIDPLDNWDKTYSHSSGLSFDVKNTQYIGNDSSRAYRMPTAPAHAEIVWKYKGISSFQATGYHWPYESISHYSFFTSSDGSTWTPATPVITQNSVGTGGNWSKYTYALSGLSNANYVKIQWNYTSGMHWNPNLGEVKLEHTGSFETTSVDPLNDWTKTYSHTPNTNFNTTNSTYIGYDPSRASRTLATNEEMIWNYNQIQSFHATTYFYHEEAISHFSFYTSPDGSTWTPITPTIHQNTAVSSAAWTNMSYTLQNLSNVNYVKVKWNKTSGYAWSPQVGQVAVTHLN